MSRVYLDTDILLALLKPRDFHKDFALSVVSSRGRNRCISAISLVELAIVAKRDLGEKDSLGLQARLGQLIPNLRVIPLSQTHVHRSDELRVRYGLGIFDSIHAAICLCEGLEMASTDEAFLRVQGLRMLKP